MVGKGKLQHEGETLPQVDAVTWAKWFSESIFDQTLALRREKKGSEPEGDTSDLIQILPDFPATQDEFLAFQSMRNLINLVYLIKEKIDLDTVPTEQRIKSQELARFMKDQSMRTPRDSVWRLLYTFAYEYERIVIDPVTQPDEEP